jgi:hypothetical protein
MSPSQDGDSTLEPTAGSSRNSLVSHTAVGEQIHGDSTMHAYERAGIPQTPDSDSELEIKRTQATADQKDEGVTIEQLLNCYATNPPAIGFSRSFSTQQAIMLALILHYMVFEIVPRVRQDHAADDSLITGCLEWIDAGRRACSLCLRTHPPPCWAYEEDFDFCQRDPEGYLLHLRSIKPAKRQNPRSNRRPGHETSRVSKPAHTQRANTQAARTGDPERQTPPPYSHLSPSVVKIMTAIAEKAADDPTSQLTTEIKLVLAPKITQGYVSEIMRHQQTTRRALLREFEEGLVRLARDAAEQTQQ